MNSYTNKYSIHNYAATAKRWLDLEVPFGKNGANAGCWCMFWRLKHSLFKKTNGDGNRLILKQIIEADKQPGILACNGMEAG